MKKVSTLLLTGIIGSSMLFAGFSGEATISNELFNLDNHEFGFTTQASSIAAEIEFSTQTGEAKGEGDIYAEITASLTLTIDEAGSITADPAEVTAANIVGDGWKVSILGVNGPVDYAADTIIDQGDDEEVYNYSVTGTTVVGVAVTLDDLATVSVGYVGDFDALENTTAYVSVEPAEIEISEGMTVQVGASLYLDNTLGNEVGASAKLAYAADDYSASVAVDTGYENGILDYDAALNVVMSPITLEAYYGTTNTNSVNDTDGAYSAIDDVLHVKAVTDLADFDVPVTLTLSGLDLVNTQALSAQADITLNEELVANVNGGYTLTGGAWYVGAGAIYTVADYVADANVTYLGGDTFKADASIESTTFVDGATLTLAWAGGDDLLNSNLGSITASCLIEF